MATRTVKARVEIDGEREYKAALAELNNGNRVLASEMKKLQAEYKGNAESTDYLTKKGEVLEKQLLQQKDKVAELRAAMENAARQTGESSAATQAWAVKLNDAEAAQFNLEHAIEENNKALNASQGELKTENESLIKVGDTVDDLAGKFGIELPDGLKKSLNEFQGFSSGAVLAMSAAAAGVASVIKLIGEMHEITKKTAADVDEILTESAVTGFSTRTIQELKYAENLMDVEAGAITGTLGKLTTALFQAGEGNLSAMQAFNDLGVYIANADGSLRDIEPVFWDVIRAIGEIDNATEASAISMQLLGKNAQDLKPLFDVGKAGVEAYGEQAEKLGYILDESMLKKLGEVDDAAQKLQLTWEASEKQLAAQFAPASKQAMEAFATAVKAAGDTLVRSGIVKGLGDILIAVSGLMDPIEAILGIIPGLESELQPLYTVLHAIAGAIAWIADATNAGIGFLTGFTKAGRTRLNTALGLNADIGMYSNLQRWDGTAERYEAARAGNWAIGSDGTYAAAFVPSEQDYENAWIGLNAAGTSNWRGGLTYLGEGGPEMAILPRGTKILNSQDARSFGDSFGDIYISVDAKNVQEFNDLIEIAKSARIRYRMN